MPNTKIIQHTMYTYETTDNREFSSKEAATEWQNYLDVMSSITMFDSNFKATDNSDSIYFVYIKNTKELNAFNNILNYEGFATSITEPGYYYYDEVAGDYINIDSEIAKLLEIKTKLDAAARL